MSDALLLFELFLLLLALGICAYVIVDILRFLITGR